MEGDELEMIFNKTKKKIKDLEDTNVFLASEISRLVNDKEQLKKRVKEQEEIIGTLTFYMNFQKITK